MPRYRIYVPNADVQSTSPGLRSIVPGSAMVADPEASTGDFVTVYFEGGIYRQANVRTFGEKLLHAAGRLFTRYPTSALVMVQRDQVLPVGWADYDEQTRCWYVSELENPEILQKWLGNEPLPHVGVSPEQRRVAASRVLSSLHPDVREDYVRRIERGEDVVGELVGLVRQDRKDEDPAP